jgi:hypothetical protein
VQWIVHPALKFSPARSTKLAGIWPAFTTFRLQPAVCAGSTLLRITCAPAAVAW